MSEVVEQAGDGQDGAERLSADDLQMLQAAHAQVAALRDAEAAKRFIEAALARKYNLEDGVLIEPDGRITRK